MWTPSDRFQRLPGKRSLRVAAILLVLGTGAAAYAAPAPQSADRPPATAQERGDLRRALESRYEVLPVSGGVVLKPRQPKAGIRTVEVTGDQIAVNGERVNANILRDWLGADADAVIRLQGLSAADQRQLFGISGETAARPPASTSEVPDEAATSDEPATSDVDVTETTTEAPEAPAAPEAPEAPEASELRIPSRHNAGSRINVGGSVHVRQNETADDAVAIGGSVDVDGEVSDGVTAIGGDVRIEGKASGDVVSVGGSVYLGPHAVVNGDVTSVGGSIERSPGATINGATSEVDMGHFLRNRGFRHGPFWRGHGHWGLWNGVSNLLGSLMSLVLTGLLVCLVLLVARRPLERVDRQLAAQPWRAAAVGLAGSIFFWPLLAVLTVLLAITIVGCALFLLYPFLLLYVALLLLLGYATAAYRLGRWLEIRFNRNFGGPYAAALVGVVSLQIWHVLGNLFDLMPGPFSFFSFMTSLFGSLVTTAALVTGFGAVILSRFGLEPGYWPRQGAPMPPMSPASGVETLPLTDPLTSPPIERWEDPGEYSEGSEPPR
jgi:cytoskeletal protein CcmA (bactofilin family)